jgi:hypothetical protein
MAVVGGAFDGSGRIWQHLMAMAMEYGKAMMTQTWHLTPVVAVGDSRHQRLLGAISNDGHWHLTATMDCSNISGSGGYQSFLMVAGMDNGKVVVRQ